MTAGEVQRAYGARAAEYAEHLGVMEAVAAPDRELVLSWAQTLTGPVLDVGCGPGHWTAYLHEHNVEIVGIDPTPEFITHARTAHPGITFRDGQAERLDAPDGSLGGVLAWYSLIHSEPAAATAALVEFARALRPGGGLLLGFFEGPVFEPFDHAITTAYRWPIGELSALLQQAGFTVTETHTRTDPGVRPHGAIVATRNSAHRGRVTGIRRRPGGS
ncbi:MAG: class I SAM-dependent methyltransferase [Propioniciclava sp.]|nr:class I SAM-dependent methyltransferase [Actinomycetota bacterium]